MKSFDDIKDFDGAPVGGGYPVYYPPIVNDSPYHPSVIPTIYPVGPVIDVPIEPAENYPTVAVKPPIGQTAPVNPSPTAAATPVDDDFEIDETTLLIGGAILAAVLLLK